MRNIQRFLLIIILMNILIGLSQTLYYEPTTYDENFLSNENRLYEQHKDDFEDPNKLYSEAKNNNLITDNTIGSSLNWGSIIMGTFINGLNTLSISPADFTTIPEQLIARLLQLFRSLMYILGILQIYLIIKNRAS